MFNVVIENSKSLLVEVRETRKSNKYFQSTTDILIKYIKTRPKNGNFFLKRLFLLFLC